MGAKLTLPCLPTTPGREARERAAAVSAAATQFLETADDDVLVFCPSEHRNETKEP